MNNVKLQQKDLEEYYREAETEIDSDFDGALFDGLEDEIW